MQPLFITGTGTGIGKTLVSAIVANALEADYWKPVQAGFSEGTDSEWIQHLLAGTGTTVHPEAYKLKLAASPHIAARDEGITIDLERIRLQQPSTRRLLIVEGAGGLLVPLNDQDFVVDLIEKLNGKLILVSRNYLGSINHSLLTAEACRKRNLEVVGWIFNDEYLDYQDEIARWSGFPVIGKIGKLEKITSQTISHQAGLLKNNLLRMLENQ